MAENQEDRQTDDLSEEASPYRVEEYRKKGRVAQSRELSGIVALIAAGTALFLWSPTISQHLVELMTRFFRADLTTKLDLSDASALLTTFSFAMKHVAYMALPVAIVGFIVAGLGSYLQVGSIFSTDPITPDLTRLDPIRGVKRFLSMKMLYDGFRLMIRAGVTAIVAYLLVKSRILHSPHFVLGDPTGILGEYSVASRIIFASLCGLLLVFAAFDLWLQRWEYSKSVRLTKQEAKQEHKEHEGDPLVKARIRTVQREMARKRMMDAVKEADVVVTNPTHIAVALSYDRTKMDAPRVVAKGADFLAQKIKKIAAEAGVPRVENVPLARTLYRTVKVGQIVPKALYKAVAEVLAFVYKLKKKNFTQEGAE